MLLITTQTSTVIAEVTLRRSRSNGTNLVCRNLTAVPRTGTIGAVELQTVLTITIGFGDDLLRNPVRVGLDLLVDPRLQLQLVLYVPASATQRVVLELRSLVLLSVLLNLDNSFVGQIGANNLNALNLAIAGRTGDFFLSKLAQALVQVPIRLAVDGATITRLHGEFFVGDLAPTGLVTEHLLSVSATHKQLVRTGHRALGRTPAGTTRRVRYGTVRHDSLAVATNHLILVTVVAVDPNLHLLTAATSSNVVVCLELAVATLGIQVWPHVNGERAILIHRGLVHRRGHTRLATRGGLVGLFKPLRIHGGTLEVLTCSQVRGRQRLAVASNHATIRSSVTVRITRVLVVEQHRTADGLLALVNAGRVDGAVWVRSFGCILGSARLLSLRSSSKRSRGSNSMNERAHHRDRERGGCNRRTATTSRTVDFLQNHEQSFHESN